MQHCSGTNADSDATWQSSQANATARTRRRIAIMSHQSSGNRRSGQIGVRCPAMRKLWFLAGIMMLIGGVHRQQTAARADGRCRARAAARDAAVADHRAGRARPGDAHRAG